MTQTTLLFAEIAGPVLLAIAIGFFTSRAHYRNVYRNLRNETLAVFVTSAVVLSVGILIIRSESFSGTFADVLVDIFGWAFILKGLVLAMFPVFAERSATRFATRAYLPMVATVMAVVGVYFCVIAYF